MVIAFSKLGTPSNVEPNIMKVVWVCVGKEGHICMVFCDYGAGSVPLGDSRW